MISRPFKLLIMGKNSLLGLIKFGWEDHMLDLYHNGTIYLNDLSYFKEVDKNENRADIYEGITNIKQVNWLKVATKDGKTIFELSRDGEQGGRLLSAQLRESIPGLKGNIYCMYAFTPDWPTNNKCIDPRNINFGDDRPTMVVIENISEFSKRIIEKLDELGLSGTGKLVTYYDEKTHEGDLGVFHKSSRFSYQCEFRLFVGHKKDMMYESNGALRFQLGPLHDIASIHRADNLADIQVHFTENDSANTIKKI